MPADANMKWEKSSEDLVELFSEIAPKGYRSRTEEDVWLALLFCQRQPVRWPQQTKHDLPSVGAGPVALPGDARAGGLRANPRPQDKGLCAISKTAEHGTARN